MMEQEVTLKEKLRDLKFQARREQAEFLSNSPKCEEREKLAGKMIQEINMQRVFDGFTKAQEAELQDILQPLTLDGESFPLFAAGARNHLQREE